MRDDEQRQASLFGDVVGPEPARSNRTKARPASGPSSAVP